MIDYSLIIDTYNDENVENLYFVREIMKSFTQEQIIKSLKMLKDDGWKLNWIETNLDGGSIWLHKNKALGSVRYVPNDANISTEQLEEIYAK